MQTPDCFAQARAIAAELRHKVERLRNLTPYLIDVSLRENPVGSRVGHTLVNKLDMLPKLRAFGFTDIILGALNYALPDEPQVDDDFMQYLQQHAIDRSGCFALTDIGLVDALGNFRPSPSQLKLKQYGVPNTVHEIYLADAGMTGQYDFETLYASLPASIRWLRENLSGESVEPPRIIVNIVDGCDAFSENLDRTCSMLELLATLPIEGVSIEDGRGTFMPFQVGGYVAIARAFLPKSIKLLVHIHAGAGFENASVIEALLQGADGVWGGLPKRTAVNGHASLGELIANLVRIGSPAMSSYAVASLLPLTYELAALTDQEEIPADLPILGANAYRLPLSFFQQQDSRFMDLPPELIGGRYRYRICPVVSDSAVIAQRLAEVTGGAPDTFCSTVLEQMIRLMRRDLRAGHRIAYDDAAPLLELYARARIPKI